MKTKKVFALLLVIVIMLLSGPAQVLAAHPYALTGGGDNIIDPGETLSGTEEWGDAAVYPQGYFQFTAPASAGVAGEDITFTYDPLNTTGANTTNVMMDISNTSNADSNSCSNFSGYDPLDCVISSATGGGTYVIDVYHNNGSPCDTEGAADQPACDALDLESTMTAIATGGGAAVPEFHEYVLMFAIGIAIFFMFKTIPKMGGIPMGRA